MFSTIVVGTDGSDTANEAVRVATEVARQNKATLHLVNAYRPRSSAVAGGAAGASATSDDPSYQGLSRSASEKLLTELAGSLEGVTVQTHAEGGSAADVIVRVAENVTADLIVVGSKGMQGARRMIGSVPNSVARQRAV